MKHMIDTHQHLWMVSERPYSWIEENTILYDDFGPERILPALERSGVTGTVLVQAADTYEDTFYLISVAKKYEYVKGIVGWLPLDRPNEAEVAGNFYATTDVMKGVRALTHDYEDDKWITRPKVREGLAILQDLGLTLDICCFTSTHLENVAVVASEFPDLKIVIDHMAKPRILDNAWEPWARQMQISAERPNVFVKLSGLNTVSTPGNWTASSWQPYVDHIVANFGSKRIMLGSDWPVSLLNGDYEGVWKAQLDVISQLSDSEQMDITYRTADLFYSLNLEKG